MSIIAPGPPMSYADAQAIAETLEPGTALVHLPELPEEIPYPQGSAVMWHSDTATIVLHPDRRLVTVSARPLDTAQAVDLAAALIAVAAKVVATS